MEVRFQVKGDAFAGAGEETAMNGQNGDEYEEQGHHDFGDALQAFLYAEAAADQSKDDDDGHPDDALAGTGGHGVVGPLDLVLRHAAEEVDLQKFNAVGEHPARYRGVVHHQQVVACGAEIAVDVPF